MKISRVTKQQKKLNKEAGTIHKGKKHSKKTYLIYKANRGRFKWVLFWQMNPHFPNTTFIGRALGPEKLDYELIQSAKDGDLVLGLY